MNTHNIHLADALDIVNTLLASGGGSSVLVSRATLMGLRTALIEADQAWALPIEIPGLTPMEQRIYLTLDRATQVVDKEALRQACGAGSHASLWVHVARLRKKLPPGEFIDSVRGVGYQLRKAEEEPCLTL